ncbi:hypothetical protein [Pyrobaculum aerophilum]|uniref:hypothetical protein n=1 Tax=Pyrobaculum aerophilum TaxID=13773 RepID=UPI002FDB2050
MRGAASLTTLILFISFAAALSILAYIVDFYAQQVLQGDVENTAESVAEFVSSQIRDAVASGAVPGVVALKKQLIVPRNFYALDAASLSLCVGNAGGNIYVNVTLTGIRGRGEATAVATSWVYNITAWSALGGKKVYLSGVFTPCGSPTSECFAGGLVNLTRPGCAASPIDASIVIS